MKIFLDYFLDARAADTMPEEIQKKDMRSELQYKLAEGIMNFFPDEDLNFKDDQQLNPHYYPGLGNDIMLTHKKAEFAFYLFREKELEDLKEVLMVLSMTIPSSVHNGQRQAYNAVIEVLNRKFGQ